MSQDEIVRDSWRGGFEDFASQLEHTLSDTSVGGPPLQRFDALLAALLDALTKDADASRDYLTGFYANDFHATGRRTELQARFEARLVDIFDARNASGQFACRVLAAATANLTTDALVDGDVETVQALRRPLVLFAEQTLD